MMKEDSSPAPDNPKEEQTITVPVRQEQLHVATRLVDTGEGTRIHKTIVEKPYEIDEALLRDEIVVKHVAIDKIVALSDAPSPHHEGDTFIVPVLEEVLIVEKRLRIKEELHIVKKTHEERHVETVTLKSEDISIERFDEGREEPERQAHNGQSGIP
jgi:uncharacterized protein (TIGR02271 family)